MGMSSIDGAGSINWTQPISEWEQEPSNNLTLLETSEQNNRDAQASLIALNGPGGSETLARLRQLNDAIEQSQASYTPTNPMYG
jgi:hypothetical protein